MKSPILPLLPCFAATLLAPSLPADDSRTLFAALAMTKEQEASPIPTDSGVFLYDAERGEWDRIGPVIQMISSIATDPSDPATIFLACGNGIVRSQDAGQTWRMVTGWRESDVLQIAIDPRNGERVYAATAWGVTISRDGGETWAAANDGLEEKFSTTIVLDARNPDRLLLGSGSGLFVSTDHASTWEPITDIPTVAVLGLSQSSVDPDLWIAGTEGAGILLSRDNAATWQSAAPSLGSANIYGVATDPGNAKVLAAGGWEVGVATSSDGGRTWTDRRAGLPSPHITAVAFDASSRLWVSTFEEGTYFSEDLGATWQDGGLYGAYVFDLGTISSIPDEN